MLPMIKSSISTDFTYIINSKCSHNVRLLLKIRKIEIRWNKTYLFYQYHQRLGWVYVQLLLCHQHPHPHQVWPIWKYILKVFWMPVVQVNKTCLCHKINTFQIPPQYKKQFVSYSWNWHMSRHGADRWSRVLLALLVAYYLYHAMYIIQLQYIWSTSTFSWSCDYGACDGCWDRNHLKKI